MKLIKLGTAAAALGMMITAAMAAPPLKSGVQPGQDGGGAFDVVDVSGPNKGKQLCYY